MRSRRVFATAILATTLSGVALAFGPVRWGLGHSYEHVIEGTEAALPVLTTRVALPVLGIGPQTAAAALVGILFWGFAGLGPIGLLVGVWRASSREGLLDLLVYGGGLYTAGLALLVFVTLVALWLPFGLLC